MTLTLWKPLWRSSSPRIVGKLEEIEANFTINNSVLTVVLSGLELENYNTGHWLTSKLRTPTKLSGFWSQPEATDSSQCSTCRQPSCSQDQPPPTISSTCTCHQLTWRHRRPPCSVSTVCWHRVRCWTRWRQLQRRSDSRTSATRFYTTSCQLSYWVSEHTATSCRRHSASSWDNQAKGFVHVVVGRCFIISVVLKNSSLAKYLFVSKYVLMCVNVRIPSLWQLNFSG